MILSVPKNTKIPLGGNMQKKPTPKKAGRPKRKTPEITNEADIPLNTTEKLFVQHYGLSGDTALAAQKAGSDAKDLGTAGRKILARPNVRQAVSLLEKEYIVNAAVEKSEIVLILRQNIQIAHEKGDVKAANDAAKLLGSMCPDAFYSPQKQETTDDKAKKAKDITQVQAQAIDVFSMSEEEMDLKNDLVTHIKLDKSKTLGIDEFATIADIEDSLDSDWE